MAQTYKKAFAQNLKVGDKFFAYTTENKQIFGIRCNPYPEITGGVCFYSVDFKTGIIKYLMENDEVLRVVDVPDYNEEKEETTNILLDTTS